MLAVQLFGHVIADRVMIWFFSGSLLFGILGYFLAGTKGNGCWGCGLGCILGPFGLLIAMLLPDQRRLP